MSMHAKRQSFTVDTEYQPSREENRKLRIEDKIFNISDYVDELIKDDEQRQHSPKDRKISKSTEQAREFCRTEQFNEEGILTKDHVSNIIPGRFLVRKRNGAFETTKASTPVCDLLSF